ncbi:MAG: SRPBCC domain-containing protein, partial [Micromonosporaceae bacterium]|nr:SRPBCC domain-containing protein [Micromonosporaceae bacterium]
MTEIRIDVDLAHPPERVWRAMTDPKVLREWFMETAITGGEGEEPIRFTLTPDGDEGFDEPISGEVVETERPRKASMLWKAEQHHTLVTVTLTPVRAGCRLSFVQRGFLGPQGTLRRRALQRTYRQMFDEGLRAALKRLEAVDRERDNLVRHRPDLAGPAGRRSVRGNEARFGEAARRQSGVAWAGMAWAGIRAASRNMSRRSAAGTSRSPQAARQRQRARGIAAPAGEALSESMTASLSRAAWSTREGDRWAQRRRTIAIWASAAIVGLLALSAVLVVQLVQPGAPGTALGNGDQRFVLDPGGVAPSGSPDGGGAIPLPGGAVSTHSSQFVLSATYLTERQVIGGYEGI